MGSTPRSTSAVRRRASGAMQRAIQSEIETVVLDRMQRAGGRLAQLARIRSFYGSVVGGIGTLNDLFDMGYAGFQAMTINHRAVMRVSAAHAFGYWVFQDRGLPSPINPPNSFLRMHRQSDRSDAHIGEVIGNRNFSSDGGSAAADWNLDWRRGALGCLRTQGRRTTGSYKSGALQRTLQNRFGSNAQVHSQTYDACVSQYRSAILAPGFRTPATAAGSHLLAALKGEQTIEVDTCLRLYRQFPYNPRVAS